MSTLLLAKLGVSTLRVRTLELEFSCRLPLAVDKEGIEG